MDAPGHRDFIPNMIQGTAQVKYTVIISVMNFAIEIIPNRGNYSLLL